MEHLSDHPNPLIAALAIGERAMSIVDVGAAFFGEQQLYQPLLDIGIGHLTSFEPDAIKAAELRQANTTSSRDTVLDHALGDGKVHTLHLAPGGMSSLLEPDQECYDLFSLFAASPHSPVIASLTKQTIPTTRLDDVPLLAAIDFLKIDVQGAELMILHNGREKLKDCAILQVEVPFVALYKNQPTFGDIDAELRDQGFMVHGLATLKRLPLSPFKAQGPLIGINQLLDLDMIYVKNLRRMQDHPDRTLKHTAIAADLCYSSFDLALRCMHELARRGVVDPHAPDRYARYCSGRQRIGYIHYTPSIG